MLSIPVRLSAAPRASTRLALLVFGALMAFALTAGSGLVAPAASAATLQPTARQPTTLRPTARRPTARQPTARQPTARQPTARQPTARQSRMPQPTTLQPAASTLSGSGAADSKALPTGAPGTDVLCATASAAGWSTSQGWRIGTASAGLRLVACRLVVRAYLLKIATLPLPPPADPPAEQQAEPPRSRATPETWVWPLDPQPRVARGFEPPRTRWGRGHRGVDLAGADGETVRAAGAGVVGYAGRLAGRGVVVVVHRGGLRTTYEPVTASVTTGMRVDPGTPIGALERPASHCAPSVCLHWGLLRGRTYLDPLSLLTGPPRLLPLGSTALAVRPIPTDTRLWSQGDRRPDDHSAPNVGMVESSEPERLGGSAHERQKSQQDPAGVDNRGAALDVVRPERSLSTSIHEPLESTDHRSGQEPERRSRLEPSGLGIGVLAGGSTGAVLLGFLWWASSVRRSRNGSSPPEPPPAQPGASAARRESIPGPLRSLDTTARRVPVEQRSEAA